MKLIAGLGNPGTQYEKTYHNIGFMAVELLVKSINEKFGKKECKAISLHTFLNGEKVIIAKPITYMNLSGESIKDFCVKYKIDFKDILIIYDDIDIEKGTVRIRPSGSGGTHNGMKNIIECLGSNEFARIRIGIGRSENLEHDLADYVLSKIPEGCKELFLNALNSAKDAANDFAAGKNIEFLMQKYNKK